MLCLPTLCGCYQVLCLPTLCWYYKLCLPVKQAVCVSRPPVTVAEDSPPVSVEQSQTFGNLQVSVELSSSVPGLTLLAPEGLIDNIRHN